jgi:hypothetical protein
MNPLYWKREYQVALVVSFLIGGSIGVIIGYLMYAVYAAEHAMPLSGWLDAEAIAGWGLFGGAIGAAALYVRHLMRLPSN